MRGDQLAGQLPHQGLRAAELADAVQTRAPPPIRSLCPGAPQALADIVDRAIRRQRDERFQSAEKVRDALEAIRSLYQPFGVPSDTPLAGDDDASQINASFARIAPRAGEFCARVYDRLFASHPELRPLFRTDTVAQRPADTTWLVAAVVAFARRRGAPIDDAVRIACEREIARFRGVELCGLDEDRAAAMFDGPGRALRFARATLARARALGVELAAGVSFDTCRFGDANVDGDAVRLAPRIAAQAAAGEVLVSDAVRALVGGAIQLTPRGELPDEAAPIHAAVAGD